MRIIVFLYLKYLDELPGRDRVEVEGLGDDIEFSEYGKSSHMLGHLLQRS